MIDAPVRGEALANARHLIRRERVVPEPSRHLRLRHAAGGHALAVHHRRRLEGLDGVADCVAPVQRAAQPRLALVGLRQPDATLDEIDLSLDPGAGCRLLLTLLAAQHARSVVRWSG